MAPDPHPRSTISGVLSRRFMSSSKASPTSSSVSGRGIRTRASRSRSSERNGQCPSTYWIGSPPSRRRAAARMAASDASSVGENSSTNHRASRRLSPAPMSSVIRYELASIALGQLSRALLGEERVDVGIEVAGQHGVERIGRQVDPVVRHPVLLEVVSADLLAATAAPQLGALQVALF